MTETRSRTEPPTTRSPTLRRTRSQPRSLLSIARLRSARSRRLSASSSLARMAQTCRGRSYRFCPINRPLFHGGRERLVAGSWILGMVSSPSSPPTPGISTVPTRDDYSFWTSDQGVPQSAYTPLRNRRNRQRKLAPQEPGVTPSGNYAARRRSATRGLRSAGPNQRYRCQSWTPIEGHDWMPIDTITVTSLADASSHRCSTTPTLAHRCRRRASTPSSSPLSG